MDTIKRGLFVTGTDTEVGKTFVSAVILKILLDHGINATYFKPVATGCATADNGLVAEDLARIQELTKLDMSDDVHCPHKYEPPLAPLAAARLAMRPIDVENIHASLKELQSFGRVVIVEGVGGILVPITDKALLVDLMEDMNLPVIVVARPGLGTINHTLLTIEVVRERNIPVLGFVTNGPRDEHDLATVTSPSLIEQFSRTPFLGHIPFYDPEKEDFTSFVQKRCSFLKNILLGCNQGLKKVP